MNTFIRFELDRGSPRTDAVDLVLDTSEGLIPLRIPAEKLNLAITGLFAAADWLADRVPTPATAPNKELIAAPFLARSLGSVAHTPTEGVLTAHCGAVTLAIHARPQAIAALAEKAHAELQALSQAAGTQH